VSSPNVGVYIFVSPSGTVYVGQSTNLKRRFQQHKIIRKKDGNVPFHYAIKKYGFKNFYIEVIPCQRNELDFFEKLLIAFFRGIGKVYNLNDGGCGTKGFKHTPEQLQKMKENYYKLDLGRRMREGKLKASVRSVLVVVESGRSATSS
jgi:group I intron endonuclease